MAPRFRCEKCDEMSRLGQSPPWQRRGGCATNQMSRSLLSWRRGARSASAAARSIKKGSFYPPNNRSLNQPPRPLRQRRLRDIFIDVASTPPLLRRGLACSVLLSLLLLFFLSLAATLHAQTPRLSLVPV